LIPSRYTRLKLEFESPWGHWKNASPLIPSRYSRLKLEFESPWGHSAERRFLVKIGDPIKPYQ